MLLRSIMIALLLLTFSVRGEYNIGDICDDISWVTEDGESSSIYQKVDEGKTVLIFWGQSW